MALPMDGGRNAPAGSPRAPGHRPALPAPRAGRMLSDRGDQGERAMARGRVGVGGALLLGSAVALGTAAGAAAPALARGVMLRSEVGAKPSTGSYGTSCRASGSSRACP